MAKFKKMEPVPLSKEPETEFLRDQIRDHYFSLEEVVKTMELALKQLESGDSDLGEMNLESAISQTSHCFENIEMLEVRLMRLEGTHPCQPALV